jgi:hypothetical protein
MTKVFFVLLLLFLSVAIPASYPETIKLKNGKIIKGKIIERAEEYIKVDFDGASLTYYIEDIDSIDDESVAYVSKEGKALRTVGVNGQRRLTVEIITESRSLSQPLYKDIERGVRFLYHFFTSEFGFEYPANFKLKVRIFGDFKNFRDYQEKVLSRIISEVGFYSFELRGAASWIMEDEEELLRILLHEISHLFLFGQIGVVQAWIDEGLAEYFDEMRITEALVEIPIDDYKENHYYKVVVTGQR